MAVRREPPRSNRPGGCIDERFFDKDGNLDEEKASKAIAKGGPVALMSSGAKHRRKERPERGNSRDSDSSRSSSVGGTKKKALKSNEQQQQMRKGQRAQCKLEMLTNNSSPPKLINRHSASVRF